MIHMYLCVYLCSYVYFRHKRKRWRRISREEEYRVDNFTRQIVIRNCHNNDVIRGSWTKDNLEFQINKLVQPS